MEGEVLSDFLSHPWPKCNVLRPTAFLCIAAPYLLAEILWFNNRYNIIISSRLLLIKAHFKEDTENRFLGTHSLYTMQGIKLMCTPESQVEADPFLGTIQSAGPNPIKP